MTSPRDPDRLIDAFLGAGPTELPERTYDAVRDQIGHTRQRAVIGPWREPHMSNLTRVAFAAVAIVAVGFGAMQLLPGTPSLGVGGSPNPSPAATPRVSASTPVVVASPTPDTPLVLSIDTPFAVRLEFTATTAFRLWGDVGASGKGWYKHSADPPNGMGVTVWNVTNAKRDPCEGPYMDPPLGPTVDELADVLVNQPDTTVLEDVPVTLDGYSGRYLDYIAEPYRCQLPKVVRWKADTTTREALPREHDRVWILDVDGTRVVIDVFDFDKTSEADRAALRTIVESVEISPK
jgi:hypothetical protein